MAETEPSQRDLLLHIHDLTVRLEEAQETLAAIREGGVDAVVVKDGEQERIYVLEGADSAYRVLFERLNEGALTLSAEGVILYANRRFASLVQAPLERVQGAHLRSFACHEERDRLDAILSQGVSGSAKGEVALSRADGGAVPVMLSVNVVKGEGMASACTVVATDMSEIREAQDALQRAHDELEARVAERTAELAKAREAAEEANSAKDQFLALVSHELRNPLSAILAAVDLLKHAVPTDGHLGRTVQILQRSTRLQARLVTDLLDLSRIARGQVNLQRSPARLASIVRSAVQSQQPDAEQAGISLVTEVQPGLWVNGDFDRLEQVVANLVSNAVKFTPKGGRVCVRVSEAKGVTSEPDERAPEVVTPPPAAARVVVEDTGIGIDAALMEHVFEMFRQGEMGGRRPGLGIGLSLVKSLTEAHGGRVWAESEGPGKGSRFTLEFPLITPPVSHEGPPRPAMDRRELRVLVVEDNDDTRTVLCECLRLQGYVVDEAGCAEDALILLGGSRPDLIVSDIGLPGMNGYLFLRRARELPGLADVPAFAVSGFVQDDDVRRSREAGYAGHFAKPVDVTTLDRRIREWLAARSG